MNGYGTVNNPDSLDSILEEIRLKRQGESAPPQQDVPAKTWSLDDIDALLSEDSAEDKYTSLSSEFPMPDFPAPKPVIQEPVAEAPAPAPAPAPVSRAAAFDYDAFMAELGLAPEKKEEIPVSAPSADGPVEVFFEEPAPDIDKSIFAYAAPTAPVRDSVEDIYSSSGEEDVEGQEFLFDREAPAKEEYNFETVVVPDQKVEERAEQKYIDYNGIREEKKAPVVDPPRVIPKDDAALDFFRNNSVPMGEEEPAEKQEEAAEDDGTPSIDEETLRDRFFNGIKFEEQEELDVVDMGPVDKSGIVVEKTGVIEDGLTQIPRIVAAEDVLEGAIEGKTIIAGAPGEKIIPDSKPADDLVEGQIILKGFDEGDDLGDFPVFNEEDVESELSEKRKNKAKNFRISGNEELTDFGDFEFDPIPTPAQKEEKQRRSLEKEVPTGKPVAGEYTDNAEKVAVHSHLSKGEQLAEKSTIVALCFEAAFLFLCFIPKFLSVLHIESSSLRDGSAFIYIANSVLLIAIAAINSERFINGFKNLIARVPDSDSVTSLCISVAFLQSTVCALCEKHVADTIAPFGGAAVLGYLIAAFTEKIDLKRMIKNFEICAYKKEHNLYAIHRFDNESEIFELGRGLLMSNAEMLYSSKITFPTDFIKNSEQDASRSETVKKILPISGGAAVLAAIISGIVAKDFFIALTALAGTFCLVAPIFASLFPALIVFRSNQSINPSGSMIVSADAAGMVTKANAVVMDSADIFDRSLCRMHGMKDFKTIRIDDVLLYAAAMVIKAGGPLKESFTQVVGNRKDLLPQVKELNYEDKLGISARIQGQKVLFGNRAMLENHNIEIPDTSLEKKYSGNGRKIMYLAVAEKAAAIFVVSYAVDLKLLAYFKELVKHGITILVRTNDVNVTAEMLEESFSLPAGSFRILSAVAGRLFKRRKDGVTDKLSIRLAHNGSAQTMLRTLAKAGRMVGQLRLCTLAQIVLCALGLILCTVMCCTAAISWFNTIILVLAAAAGAGAIYGLLFMLRLK